MAMKEDDTMFQIVPDNVLGCLYLYKHLSNGTLHIYMLFDTYRQIPK